MRARSVGVLSWSESGRYAEDSPMYRNVPGTLEFGKLGTHRIYLLTFSSDLTQVVGPKTFSCGCTETAYRVNNILVTFLRSI